MTEDSLLSVEITPRSDGDRQRLGRAVACATAEGLELQIQRIPFVETFVVHARSEDAINTLLRRLATGFNVTAAVGARRVIYRRFSAAGSSPAAGVLHEPIMSIEVRVAEAYADDVLAGLQSRRGQVRWTVAPDGEHVIRGTAPLAELLGYADDLSERTRGNSRCTIGFDHFRPVERDDDASRVARPARLVPRLPRRVAGIEVPEPDDPSPGS